MTSLYDEFRIALHRVWNRRWLAVAVAWSVCVAGWLVVALIPNRYESTAQIQIRIQTMLSDQVGINPQDQRNVVQQIGQTLNSSANLEKVIRSTELGTTIATPTELAVAIESLRANVLVKPEQDGLFFISVKQSSGKLARDVMQRLIEVAEQDSTSGDPLAMRDMLGFLDSQIQDRSNELQEAEAKRVAYETQNLGLLPGVGSVSQRVEAARAEISQKDSQLMQARSALAALNGQLAGTPSTITGPALSGGGESALAQAQGELASMRARGFTDSHPDVIAIRKQISALRTQGATLSAASEYRSPNPAYGSLQSMRAERNAAGNEADLFVAVYDKQSEGRELVGFGQGAADPTGSWSWSANLPAPLNGKAEQIKTKGATRDVVSFYRVNGVTTGSAARVKLATMQARLLNGNQQAVAVIVSAEEKGRMPARPAIDAFVAALGNIDKMADRFAGLR